MFDLPRINSNISSKTNATTKSQNSALNPKKLKGLRNEFIKLAVKDQKISSNNGRNKSPDVEGLQVDTTQLGTDIPQIITDHQVIEGKKGHRKHHIRSHSAHNDPQPQPTFIPDDTSQQRERKKQERYAPQNADLQNIEPLTFEQIQQKIQEEYMMKLQKQQIQMQFHQAKSQAKSRKSQMLFDDQDQSELPDFDPNEVAKQINRDVSPTRQYASQQSKYKSKSSDVRSQYKSQEKKQNSITNIKIMSFQDQMAVQQTSPNKKSPEDGLKQIVVSQERQLFNVNQNQHNIQKQSSGLFGEQPAMQSDNLFQPTKNPEPQKIQNPNSQSSQPLLNPQELSNVRLENQNYGSSLSKGSRFVPASPMPQRTSKKIIKEQKEQKDDEMQKVSTFGMNQNGQGQMAQLNTYGQIKSDVMIVGPLQEIKKHNNNDAVSMNGKSDDTLSERYNAGLSSSDHDDGPITQNLLHQLSNSIKKNNTRNTQLSDNASNLSQKTEVQRFSITPGTPTTPGTGIQNQATVVEFPEVPSPLPSKLPFSFSFQPQGSFISNGPKKQNLQQILSFGARHGNIFQGPQEEDKSQVSQSEISPQGVNVMTEFNAQNTTSLRKIESQATCDFNQKSSSMLDIEKCKTQIIEYEMEEDEKSESQYQYKHYGNDVISHNNHTILEEPSNEAASQKSSQAQPEPISNKATNNKDYSTEFVLQMGASISQADHNSISKNSILSSMTNKQPKILFEKEEEEIDHFGEPIQKGVEYITLVTSDGVSFVLPCGLLRDNSKVFEKQLSNGYKETQHIFIK